MIPSLYIALLRSCCWIISHWMGIVLWLTWFLSHNMEDWVNSYQMGPDHSYQTRLDLFSYQMGADLCHTKQDLISCYTKLVLISVIPKRCWSLIPNKTGFLVIPNGCWSLSYQTRPNLLLYQMGGDLYHTKWDVTSYQTRMDLLLWQMCPDLCHTKQDLIYCYTKWVLISVIPNGTWSLIPNKTWYLFIPNGC